MIRRPPRSTLFPYTTLFRSVHIFGFSAEFFEPPGIRPGPPGNLIERRERLLHFRRGENADGLQSSSPRTIHGNLVRQETAIECKRALERVEPFVRCALEASTPQPVVFAFGHCSSQSSVISSQLATEKLISAWCWRYFTICPRPWLWAEG